jgi:hypothetical protein
MERAHPIVGADRRGPVVVRHRPWPGTARGPAPPVARHRPWPGTARGPAPPIPPTVHPLNASDGCRGIIPLPVHDWSEANGYRPLVPPDAQAVNQRRRRSTTGSARENPARARQPDRPMSAGARSRPLVGRRSHQRRRRKERGAVRWRAPGGRSAARSATVVGDDQAAPSLEPEPALGQSRRRASGDTPTRRAAVKGGRRRTRAVPRPRAGATPATPTPPGRRRARPCAIGPGG